MKTLVERELLPCPFCGAKDERLVQGFTRATDDFAYWSVECLDCACEIASDASQDEADASWNTRASLSPERDGEMRERIAQVERELATANRTATDRAYMLEAVVRMLGPKGRKVWKGWQEQGVQRIHMSWAPGADELDGEQIAQAHLDFEGAAKNAVPVDSPARNALSSKDQDHG